jgi:hypothetical protein
MIFPYGNQGNALAMQVAADNWFRLANGYWGYPPPGYRHIPIVHRLFFNPTIPTSATASVQLRQLIAQQKVTRIVALAPFAPAVEQLLGQRNLRNLYRGQGDVVWAMNIKRAPKV